MKTFTADKKIQNEKHFYNMFTPQEKTLTHFYRRIPCLRKILLPHALVSLLLSANLLAI